MSLNEVIRTAGDVRRTLAQTMVEVRTGQLSVDKGMCIAALSKEISGSLQVEVNIAKVKVQLLASGADIGRLTHIGKMIIEDAGTIQTISGGAQL